MGPWALRGGAEATGVGASTCAETARSGLGPEGGPLAMVPSLAASQIGAPGPAAFPPGPQCPCLYLGPTRHFLGGHREASRDSCVCGLVHGAGLPGVPEGLYLLSSSPLSPSACLLPRSPLSSCGNRGGQTRPHTLPPSPRTRARGPQTSPPRCCPTAAADLGLPDAT